MTPRPRRRSSSPRRGFLWSSQPLRRHDVRPAGDDLRRRAALPRPLQGSDPAPAALAHKDRGLAGDLGRHVGIGGRGEEHRRRRHDRLDGDRRPSENASMKVATNAPSNFAAHLAKTTFRCWPVAISR